MGSKTGGPSVKSRYTYEYTNECTYSSVSKASGSGRSKTLDCSWGRTYLHVKKFDAERFLVYRRKTYKTVWSVTILL